MKLQEYLLSFFLGLLITGLILGISDSAIKKTKEPKTVFQIGKCYRLENNNPFEKTELVIDIIDIQGDYIQFGVSLDGAWTGVNSSYIPNAVEIYTETQCQK